MSYLELAKRVEAARKKAADGQLSPLNDISEGPIVAVEICSNVLEAHIWLAFTEDFDPRDGQAIFYADEIEFLKSKDAQTLREVHKVKLANGGRGRVRQ
jgi:hypothetical protein